VEGESPAFANAPSGKGSLHTFQPGSILDNQDQVILARGQSLTDEQILNMEFLVQGVQGSLP
jgi:simple sugar transport system substrate-binding protein